MSRRRAVYLDPPRARRSPGSFLAGYCTGLAVGILLALAVAAWPWW